MFPCSYRSISITSTISKVMEKIIVYQLHEYLAEHNILTPVQFSFSHGHSTILQLINCHLNWVFNQNDDFATDVVF